MTSLYSTLHLSLPLSLSTSFPLSFNLSPLPSLYLFSPLLPSLSPSVSLSLPLTFHLSLPPSLSLCLILIQLLNNFSASLPLTVSSMLHYRFDVRFNWESYRTAYTDNRSEEFLSILVVWRVQITDQFKLYFYLFPLISLKLRFASNLMQFQFLTRSQFRYLRAHR